MSQRRDDFTVFAQLAEPECLLNLSPDLYACVENELFGSLGQPCDASCPWTWLLKEFVLNIRWEVIPLHDDCAA